MRKLVIIGLDGASPILIDRLSQEGVLPHFSTLIHEGIFTRLESVIPTISSTAWSSFATGVNPGKHNVFGFLKLVQGKQKILSSLDRKAPPIWQYLSQAGKKVAVVNMPLTFPVDPINGIMVSGMLTPSGSEHFTYPADFRDELLTNVPGYEIDITETLWAGNRERYLDKVVELTEKKEQLALYLLKKEVWDAFFFIITELDRLQHFFWPSNESGKFQSAVRDYYILLDGIIGRIMDAAGSDADFLIVSDHGFGEVKKYVHINSILRDKGFLAPPKMARFGAAKRIELIRTISKVIMKTGVNLEKVRQLVPSKLVESLTVSLSQVEVDMVSSDAYFSSGLGEGIFILNNHGYNYQDLKEKIVGKLLEVRDDETDEPVFEKIFKREELYNGPFVLNSADLIVSFKQGYCSSADLTDSFRWFSRPRPNTINGDHLIDGLFMAKGKSFDSKKDVRKLSITDIMPAILFLFGLSIPSDVDGRVPLEIFNESLREKPIMTTETHGELPSKGPESFTKKDEDAIMEQLKSLGYV